MEWIFAHSASAAPCEESRGQDLPLSYPSVIFQPLRPHYLHPAHHDPRYSHGSLLVLVTLAGFDMIDMLAQSQGISPTRHHFKALFAEGMVEGVPVLLAKPQTLGHLLPIINYHLIVSLWHLMARTCPVEFFVYNLKEDSGAIMGIGCPPGQMDPKAFVLQKFNKTSLERIDSAIEEGVEILKLVVTKGL
uniref:Uncharacterized protein n=1 Tax=Oryza nivara TaxID=4536 RepID=A0A0E0HJF9_ORYNI